MILHASLGLTNNKGSKAPYNFLNHLSNEPQPRQQLAHHERTCSNPFLLGTATIAEITLCTSAYLDSANHRTTNQLSGQYDSSRGKLHCLRGHPHQDQLAVRFEHIEVWREGVLG